LTFLEGSALFTWIGEVDGIPVVWGRPDSVAILEDKEAIQTFSRYWRILKNKTIAKFLIAKLIEVDYDEDLSLEELWNVHDDAMRDFKRILNEFSDEEIIEMWRSRRLSEKNLLKLKRDIAWKILESCRFCEWKCRVNRLKSSNGACRLGKDAYVASVFIHIGEEPELVPSYTVFFSHCNFKCVFCQNWDISQIHSGSPVEPEHLARVIYHEWSHRRIRNVNWVGGEPTPNLHFILDVLVRLDANIPQVWNSNLYNSVEALKLLDGVIDLWLPDFKYGNNDCALRLSKIPKYFDVVTRNLGIINSNGDEILIRHLVLPNHIECCSKPVLEWIAKNLDRSKVRVNVMAQYRPEYKAKKYPDIARRIRREEWKEAFEYARQLGLNLTI